MYIYLNFLNTFKIKNIYVSFLNLKRKVYKSDYYITPIKLLHMRKFSHKEILQRRKTYHLIN